MASRNNNNQVENHAIVSSKESLRNDRNKHGSSDINHHQTFTMSQSKSRRKFSDKKKGSTKTNESPDTHA